MAVLRATGGLEVAIRRGGEAAQAERQRLAMHWAHIVRNRRRWSRSESSDDLRRRALEAVVQLGVGKRDLTKLATSDHIEVSIPYQREDQGWEARVLPWEYLLSAAIRTSRDDGASDGMLVTRHLERPGRVPTVNRSASLAVIESTPGTLADVYALADEGRLLSASFGVRGETIRDPTPDELRARLAATHPRLLHFTGVDNREARELTQIDDVHGFDGLCLRGTGLRPLAVGATEVAELLTAGDPPPAVVTLTAFNTGSRVASMIVAAGAGAAIGFQDRFDEAQAELFYAYFYRGLARSRDVVAAFRAAYEVVRGTGALRGTGIVLWSGRSLLADAAKAGWTRVFEQLQEEPFSDLPPRDTEDAEDLVTVDVRPTQRINYSLLHNDRDLFERFVVRKLVPQRVRDVCVDAELFVGTARFPFRRSFELRRPIDDLTGAIRIPLTWDLARSFVESVKTTLFVSVQVGNDVVLRETFAVELLPPSEWSDNDEDGPWLPSFVLPRDPIIERLVHDARRSLQVLLDDPDASFDGYQSEDPEAPDPGEAIDLQVRALWSCALFELDLGYVNPPPTYSPAGQRLRTPTDVLRSRTGTCIDLALLLASLLEYVEIYPVVFLLDDHAFVGYWRTSEAYERFRSMDEAIGEAPEAADGRGAMRYGYVIEPGEYAELGRFIANADLVPLEATCLCSRDGFGEAVARGLASFRRRASFHSMLDVRMAREAGVTPLPWPGAMSDKEVNR